MPNFGLKSIARNMANMFRFTKRTENRKVETQVKQALEEQKKTKEARTPEYGGGRKLKLKKGMMKVRPQAHQTLESFHGGQFRPMNLNHRRGGRG
jgi:hypothetical protein